MRSAIFGPGWMWGLVLASTLGLAACDANPTPAPSPSSASSSSVAARSSTCPATAQFSEAAGLPERQGAGSGATLWALFFPTEPTLRAGQEIKVVWRMTGTGDLSINAIGPNGSVVKPAWGPEPHGGSSWNRPGDEWGTGWTFPTAGCWTVRAKRTNGSGSLVLRVA